jgi:hypothetical protein
MQTKARSAAVVVGLVLAVLLAAPDGSAQSTATLVFPSIADTYVEGGTNAGKNFNDDTRLRIDRAPIRIAYLRFAVTGASGWQVEQARLRLGAVTPSVRGGTVHRIGDGSWNEATLTYDTRPAVDGPGLHTLGPVSDGQVVEFDLGGTVSGDGQYDLAIDTTSSDGVSYASAAATTGQRPELVVVLSNRQPTLTILGPPNGSTFTAGEPITLEATATDPEDGDLGAAVAWTSSLQGPLGTGATITPALVEGAHTISASVTDRGGLESADAIDVTVLPAPPNTPPTVAVAAPTDGEILAAGAVVTFAATASDAEDGDLTPELEWTSSLDGPIGTGGSFARPLSAGLHQITAAVTDARGLTGSATVRVAAGAAALVFLPAADTYVDASAPSTAFGTSTELVADAEPVREALLRFVVSGIAPFAVGQATLRLTAGTTSSAASIWGGTIHAISDDTWTEATTYGGRPLVDGPPLAAAGAVARSQVVDFDVSAAVTGDETYSFALASASEDGVKYRSREASTGRPQLIVTLAGGRDQPPVVNVLAPADEAILLAAKPVVLQATAVDPEDGDLDAAVQWTSSRDGLLGSGATLTVPTLSVGSHVLTAAVIDAGSSSRSAAVSVTVTQSTLTFLPVADTYVDASAPSTAFGTSNQLLADASAVRQAFLRFSVAGVAPFTVDQARLQVTVGSAGSAASNSGGTVHAMTPDRWSESTTWNTRPAIDGPPLASRGAVAAGAVVDFDVTGAVAATGTHDFALTSASSDGVKYRSREASSKRPQLVLSLKAPSDDVGVQDFAFGPDVERGENKATAQKPESKLWFHDGLWWATLFRPDAGTHTIHWLDTASQTWVDTGVAVDERARSRQDVLWDGQKLYLASRFGGPQAQNRLYRYSYGAASRLWTLDPGFPVDIPGGGTEALTLAKDSTGTLWIAYTLGGQVLVDRTLGSDALWGTPLVIPVAEGTTVAADDIAAVVSLPGRIGVFWSNQRTDTDYFALHVDGAAATDPAAWTLEIAAAGNSVADDHMNLKRAADGRLFAAVKTSRQGPGATSIGLLVRSATGVWSGLHKVTDVEFNPTRPLCLLDEVSRRVYVFYSLNHAAIYYKSSGLDAVAFPGGSGAPLVAHPATTDINDPTSTKQSVGPATGIVVVASSSQSGSYWHNAIAAGTP